MEKKQIDNNRISKDFKYIALYWALGFEPDETAVFAKDYGQCKLYIDTADGCAWTDGDFIFSRGKNLRLNTHVAFVILECIDRLLTLGYNASDIEVNEDDYWAIRVGSIFIHCEEWIWESDMILDKFVDNLKCSDVYAVYSSRLYSGFIDYRQLVFIGKEKYNYGLFDCRAEQIEYKMIHEYRDGEFDFFGDEIVGYHGNDKVIVIPEGVTSLASCLFWDNHVIEELRLPSSLVKIGGDLCFNCKNLKRVDIPKSVTVMGDNPFAGCPNLVLTNQSAEFLWDGHVLYDRKGKLIYCQIKDAPTIINIENGTSIIGKHAFYLCNEIEKIVVPSSVKKMQNFPFSGCGKLQELEINTHAYTLVDGVVYTGDMTELVGCLNSNEIQLLVIPEGVENISRNSFYCCTGVKKVVLPSTLSLIGYNPFNRCENIEFDSKSALFKVIDGRLYNEGITRLICSPMRFSIGDVRLPDSVIELERNAFSGCHKLNSIVLKNVCKIGKSCFSGCTSLRNIYIPDHVSYIGEWAFAHCSQLSSISIYKGTFVDRNAFSNTVCKIQIRTSRTNYLVKSDNINFLKGCRESLKGEISSIIIDPPYNSKIDGIGYCDDFGNRRGYRQFLQKRLKIAYDMLADTGYLVICIDRGGLFTVCKVAWSLFGFAKVRVHLWKKLDKEIDVNKEIRPDKPKVLFEYIVVCKKQKNTKPFCKIPFMFDGYGTTSSAKDELALVFGSRTAFSTPKPVALIKKIISATTPRDGVVLDFFAGSGTTAIATMELNKEDGGSRNYILVEESDCANKITEPRIQFYEKSCSSEHCFID